MILYNGHTYGSFVNYMGRWYLTHINYSCCSGIIPNRCDLDAVEDLYAESGCKIMSIEEFAVKLGFAVHCNA